MTANAHTNASTREHFPRRKMDPQRRTALAAGVLYLLTFASMPTVALYGPVRNNAGDFALGAGNPAVLQWGALSEVFVGLMCIATAVVLYPVLRRVSETAALGLVATRILEATLIFVGAVSMLSLITLRTLGTDVGDVGSAAAVATTAQSLVATYNWTFLVSQSLMPVANDLLLGYMFYRSGLVPRIFPVIAFIGAPLLLISDLAIYFGAVGQSSPLTALAALPVAVFEFSLGIYLIARGFKPAPLAALPGAGRGILP
ncbi:DUF4386 domain-containing protein [Micrococcaceae bacterium RIT802]|nr:DUF4386 domain-containing protein [Micrococcaceae bacterium RIT 802]